MEEICPLAGQLYKSETMLRNLVESARKQIFRLVNELEPKVLRSMLKIEEHQTFKIDEDNTGRSILDKLTSKHKT